MKDLEIKLLQVLKSMPWREIQVVLLKMNLCVATVTSQSFTKQTFAVGPFFFFF